VSMSSVHLDVKQELSEKGFVFIPRWKLELSINELASNVGKVVKISDYLNHSMIPDVQKVTPKERESSIKSHYSGEFGLNAFPLHTDLAHWGKPPKYIMMRCINGNERVATKVLPLNIIWEILQDHGLRRAVVKTRGRRCCLLPLLFNTNEEQCIRWDSHFLEPVNESASVIRDLMLSKKVWDLAIDIKLKNFGDTLILNNHSHFHGRSKVSSDCVDRELERIYFN